nr:trehalase [Equus asinus]
MPERTWELRLLLLLGLGLGSQEALPPPCESQIYCQGELLHQVQMAKLYQDDKQFVDMPLSSAPDQVLQRFNELAEAHNHSIPQQQLQLFVQEHFQPVGQELEPWTPEDWKERYNPGQGTGEGPLGGAASLNSEGPVFFQPPVPADNLRPQPASLGRAAAPALEEAGKEGISVLGLPQSLTEKDGPERGVKPEVLSHPEQFSLIYSEHPFIVPGGRFVEFYYWDSYWVMEGLLLSEMPETVKGMLQNFLDLVQTYGHVPNGARVYYLQRSQPPLLTLMMDRYMTHTNDTAFLRDNIETLALEVDFWAENRSISVSSGGKSYVLNRYYVPYGGPRTAEVHSKDRGGGEEAPTAQDQLEGQPAVTSSRLSPPTPGQSRAVGPKGQLSQHGSVSSLGTGAQSLLVPDQPPPLARPESYSKDAELADTLPEGDREDLFAELKAGAESGWDFSSRWFIGGPNPDLLSSTRTSKFVPVDLNAFLCQAEELMSNFYARLGNDTQATKYRNLRAQRLAAMEAILWDEEKGAWFDYDLETGKKNAEFYPSNLAPLWAGCFSDLGDVDKALKYLEDSQILTYHYGIPTSLRKTGQQWDLPNAWAPLQDLVIRGLAKSPSPRAQEVAFQLAQNWIRTNFDVYSNTSAMYEKYDISNSGQPGGGGEYEVQEGFGWTNGVVLMLLDRYGDRLSSGTWTVFLEPHCLAAALLLSLLLSLLPQ